ASRQVLWWASVLLPLLLLASFALMLLVAQSTVDHGAIDQFTSDSSATAAGDAYIRSVIRGAIAVALLGYGPVFMLQGLIFALYFREGRQEGMLSNVYAADLLASGAGALVGGALTFFMTPVQMVVVASGVLLVNVWFASAYLRIPRRLALGASILTLALI